jgi:hypothetical protein
LSQEAEQVGRHCIKALTLTRADFLAPYAIFMAPRADESLISSFVDILARKCDLRAQGTQEKLRKTAANKPLEFSRQKKHLAKLASQ